MNTRMPLDEFRVVEMDRRSGRKAYDLTPEEKIEVDRRNAANGMAGVVADRNTRPQTEDRDKTWRKCHRKLPGAIRDDPLGC